MTVDRYITLLVYRHLSQRKREKQEARLEDREQKICFFRKPARPDGEDGVAPSAAPRSIGRPGQAMALRLPAGGVLGVWLAPRLLAPVRYARRIPLSPSSAVAPGMLSARASSREASGEAKPVGRFDSHLHVWARPEEVTLSWSQHIVVFNVWKVCTESHQGKVWQLSLTRLSPSTISPIS